ncbi:MAG TPA: tetratricopeptide repeat protein [Verrucomicrobiae bacterium]|nr:tetratricopeptide repeat protein [Verrucomicrobiae bacterium]
MNNQDQTQRDQQARDIFLRAIEIHSPEAQADFIQKACLQDDSLRFRVEALLKNHKKDSFLETAVLDRGTIFVNPTPLSEGPGTVIGRYKLLQQIGEGGMGVVYMAEQEEPVRRRVALKIIKLGMDTKSVVARFEAERQALAIMDHPNIAKVLDGGATETGRPYFVMELVQGVPITTFCDKAKLSAKERLKLFIQVCQAIQSAHQKGIIHRDIKPSNVLVTLHDGVPVPKVIDFGIAKATNHKLTEKTLFTNFASMIGTPAYMSPEQAEMSGLDVDTRTDVYALGVLLYELLTGSTPFPEKRLRSLGYGEMQRVIMEEEPERPSTRVSTMAKEQKMVVARNRGEELASLNNLLRGDLDWIIMKALEKDRTRRYETANGFAADIRRHLNSEPVVARPATAAYRFAKVVRRNRLACGAAAAVAFALLLGVVVSAWEASNAKRAAKLAEQRRLESDKAREEAESVSSFLMDLFRSPDPSRDGRTITMVETLDRAVKWLDNTLTNQPERKAKMQATLGLTYASLGLKREAVPLFEKARNYLLKPSVLKDPETYNLTCEAMGTLEGSYLVMGRREEATSLSEQLFKLLRDANGLQHPKTIDAMGNLAATYYNIGRQQEATKLAEDALNLSRRVNGPEHTNTISAMLVLSDLYQGVSSLQTNVLQLREEALRLATKVQGPGGTVTLAAMAELAGSYDRAGRTDDALRLREESLRLCKNAKGSEHPETVNAMWGLADSLTAAGRRTEALKVREEILGLRKKINGPEHPDTFFAMYILANAYSDAGRLNDALRLREETLRLSRKIFGPEDENTLIAMLGLAGSYGGLPSHRSDALKLREEIVSLRTRLTGPEAPNTIAVMFSLATSYADTGRRSEALKLREQLLELNRKVNGPEHSETLRAMIDLGESYTEADRTDEAINLYREALKLDSRTRSPQSPAWVGAMSDLAVAYAKASQTNEAARLLDEASMSKHLGAFNAIKIALLQAWYGMDAQFEVTRQRMLKSCADSDDVTEASYTAKLACVRPILEPDFQQSALTLGRRAVALLQNDSWVYLHQLGLGMAEYRSGHFPEAEQAFIAADTGATEHPEGPCPGGVKAAARLYRAMTLFRQGRTAEATKIYDEISAEMKLHPDDEENPLANGASYEDVIAWLAWRETKAMLSATSAAKP